MKKYLRVLIHLFKFGQVAFMEYRADFFLTWIGDVLLALFTVVFFNVVYAQTKLISGWSIGEIYVLLATVNFIEALIYFLYAESVRNIVRKLPKGDLDFYLIRPIDFQFLTTFSNISPQTLGPIVPAIVLLCLGLNSLSSISLGKMLIYFGLLFLSLVVHYSVLLIISSLSIFTIRTEGLTHLDGRLRELGSRPIDVYPKLLRYIFYTVMPVAFFGSIPALALRQTFSPMLVWYTLAIAIVFLYSSRKIFYVCLRHYSSASS
jgi:ABC-2 type transport system permease protein